MIDPIAIFSTTVLPGSGDGCFVELVLAEPVPQTPDTPPEIEDHVKPLPQYNCIQIRLKITMNDMRDPPTLAEYQIAALDQAIVVCLEHQMRLNETLRPLSRQKPLGRP